MNSRDQLIELQWAVRRAWLNQVRVPTLGYIRWGYYEKVTGIRL